MKFCENCGSYMKKQIEGFVCPQCGREVHTKIIEVKDGRDSDSNSIYVVDGSKIEYVKVKQTCPRCGNSEAFRHFSSISGDHAGVKQERTVEHLKCTKCLYSWSKG